MAITTNVERMLKRVLSGKGNVLLCGTCMDARGLGWTGGSIHPPKAQFLICLKGHLEVTASDGDKRAAAPWTNLQTRQWNLTKSLYSSIHRGAHR